MCTKKWKMRGYRQRSSVMARAERRYTPVIDCWGCGQRITVDPDIWLTAEQLLALRKGETLKVWVSGGYAGSQGYTISVSPDSIEKDVNAKRRLSGDYICPNCWAILQKRTPGDRALIRQTLDKAEKENWKKVTRAQRREWESGVTIKLYEGCDDERRAAIYKKASIHTTLL